MSAWSGLVADIGGTNARIALVGADGGLARPGRYLCADFPNLAAALRRYAEDQGLDALPSRAAVCAAGPVEDGRVRMTNHAWEIDAAATADDLGMDRLGLINDFKAQALALPALGPGDLFPIAPGRAVPGAATAVMGPGTGLGVAGLMPGAGIGDVVTSEGGHMTAAPRDADEARVVTALEGRFGHVSYERLASGPGLEHIYGVLSRNGGTLSAAEISRRAQDGSDDACVRALDLFFRFLGSAAADVVLALGARGGLYLAGGILPGMTGALAASGFHARFCDKGRFRDYLAAVPIQVVVHPAPAQLGLMRLLAGAGDD